MQGVAARPPALGICHPLSAQLSSAAYAPDASRALRMLNWPTIPLPRVSPLLPLAARANQALGMIVVALAILALIIFSDRLCRRFLLRLTLRSPVLQGNLA